MQMFDMGKYGFDIALAYGLSLALLLVFILVSIRQSYIIQKKLRAFSENEKDQKP